MESPTTANQTVAPKRKTLWRYLAAFATLCLLLWSIKAIHHAIQPKYQGKTMGDWFDEIRCDVDRKFGYSTLLNDPAAQAFSHFGEPGAIYLAEQIQPEVSPFSAELVHSIRLWTGGRINLDSAEIRNIKAAEALRQMGTNAAPAVPVLARLAQSSSEYGSNIVMRLVYDIDSSSRRQAP